MYCAATTTTSCNNAAAATTSATMQQDWGNSNNNKCATMLPQQPVATMLQQQQVEQGFTYPHFFAPIQEGMLNSIKLIDLAQATLTQSLPVTDIDSIRDWIRDWNGQAVTGFVSCICFFAFRWLSPPS